MNDRGQKAGVLRFGAFELELSSNELRRAGALVKLQSQHFQLLALLAERAGQVVSREEIRRRSGTTRRSWISTGASIFA